MKHPTHWLLLRGLSRDSRHWAGFDLVLGDAFPQARILTYDLPGNGRRRHERSPLSIDAYADDLLHYRQTLPASWHIAVFGLSLGGMVALSAGCCAPNAFSHLVIANTSAAGVTAWRQRLQLSGILNALPGALRAWSAEQLILSLTSMRHPHNAALLAQWQQFRRDYHCSAANLLRQLWAARGFELPAAPASLPVLVLASCQDRLVAPCAAQAIATRLQCPVSWIDEAGHDVTLDQPERTLSRIRTWLRSTRTPPHECHLSMRE